MSYHSRGLQDKLDTTPQVVNTLTVLLGVLAAGDAAADELGCSETHTQDVKYNTAVAWYCWKELVFLSKV